jgi:thiol:disulfide interchange protein
MIHADWCNSCNVFKTNVLNDAEIKDLLENKIVVSLIDGDKPYGQLYYNQYNAQGFPTLLVLDAEGKELKRNKGALSMNEFQSWIKDYLK